MKKKCYSLDQTSECRYINNNLHLYSDSEILVNKQKIGVNLFIQSIWQITDCKSVKFSYPVSIFFKEKNYTKAEICNRRCAALHEQSGYMEEKRN